MNIEPLTHLICRERGYSRFISQLLEAANFGKQKQKQNCFALKINNKRKGVNGWQLEMIVGRVTEW